MMRRFRSAAAAFVLVLPCALSGLAADAQEAGTTEALETAMAAGWKATFICSGLFVAGQTLPEIERNELSGIYPDYQRRYDALPGAEIDEARKLVSVFYSADMPPRMAAFRPGFGCTQLPVGAGEEALGFLPRFASWPVVAGPDRGSAIGSDIKVELKIEDVAERYDRGIDHETPVRTWSVAKSITATLIGAARRQGLIDIDYPAVIADWNKGADPRRDITLRNLLHM
ncbi:MAG: serine hydrolase, partial [Hyphomonas sp.]